MTHLVTKDRHWYAFYLIWDCIKLPLHLVIFCAHPSNKKQYILFYFYFAVRSFPRFIPPDCLTT